MGVAYVHTLWVRLVLLCFSHSTHHVPYDLKLSIDTFEAAELLNALGDISLTFLFRMIFFFFLVLMSLKYGVRYSWNFFHRKA